MWQFKTRFIKRQWFDHLIVKEDIGWIGDWTQFRKGNRLIEEGTRQSQLGVHGQAWEGEGEHEGQDHPSGGQAERTAAEGNESDVLAGDGAFSLEHGTRHPHQSENGATGLFG